MKNDSIITIINSKCLYSKSIYINKVFSNLYKKIIKNEYEGLFDKGQNNFLFVPDQLADTDSCAKYNSIDDIELKKCNLISFSLGLNNFKNKIKNKANQKYQEVYKQALSTFDRFLDEHGNWKLERNDIYRKRIGAFYNKFIKAFSKKGIDAYAFSNYNHLHFLTYLEDFTKILNRDFENFKDNSNFPGSFLRIEDITYLLGQIKYFEKLEKIALFRYKYFYLKNKMPIDNVFLTIGRHGLCNISVESYFNQKIILSDGNDDWISKNRIIAKSSTFSKCNDVAKRAMSFYDSFELIFEFIDLDEILFNKKSKYCHFIDNKNIDIKRTFSTKYSISQSTLDDITENFPLYLINQYRFLVNFFSAYLVKYRTLTSAALGQEIYVWILEPKYKYNLFLSKDYKGFNGLINHSKNDDNGLFIYCNNISFGYGVPLYLINLNGYTKSDIITHDFRYFSETIYQQICSCVIYLSMSQLGHTLLRQEARRLRGKFTYFLRMCVIHNLANNYSNFILCYSSNSLYSKSERQSLFFDIISSTHFKDLEQETEQLYSNLWQEANITNGKNVPILGLIISAVTFIYTIIYIANPKTYFGTPLYILLGILGLFILIQVGIYIFGMRKK